MISPENIANVLALKTSITSLSQLAQAVSDGLPKKTLDACIKRLTPYKQEQLSLRRRIITEATYKRRKNRFAPEESERIERLARIIATTEYVWDDIAAGRQFLMTPNPVLQNQTPLDVGRSELGARRIEDLLWAIFYGLPL